MASFRKRNNPSEEDEPLLVDDFSSHENIAIVSVKDPFMDTLEKRQATFEDIVPIVVAAESSRGLRGNDGDSMEFEAIDVLDDDND